MKRGILVTLIIFFLAVVQVSASELTLEKSDFVGGETLVGHIVLDDNQSASVLREGITFERANLKQDVIVFLLEENKKSYYFYFDVPRNSVEGKYDVKARVRFVEDDVLQEEIISTAVDVRVLDSRFKRLEDSVSTDGNVNNDFLTTAFTALALKRVNPELAEKSADWVETKMDSRGCFESNSCTVTDSVIGLKVLEDFSRSSDKTESWVQAAKNEVTDGTFALYIEEGDGQCTVDNQEVSWDFESEPFSMEIFDNVEVSCNADADVSVTYSHLGTLYPNLYSKEGSSVTINIDQDGCHGTSFKNNCDLESSTWASLFLDERSTWLKDNFDDQNSLAAVILKKFNNEEYYDDWISANQNGDGSYPESASQSSGDPLTTAVAYKLFPENNTLDWLKDQDVSLLETAQILYFAFDNQQKSDTVSINPGVILDAKEGSITFSNKGENPVQVILEAPEFIKLNTKNFLLETSEKVNIEITERKDGVIDVSYGNRTNKILVISSGVVDDPTEGTIILETVGTNVQTEGLTLDEGKSSRGSIKIKNTGDVDASNLEVIIQGSIADIMKVEEQTFNLSSKEEKELVLIINEDLKAKGEYTGELVVMTEQEKFLEIPLGVNFKEITQEVTQENESEKGIFEEPEERDEEEPEEEEKKGGAWKRWLILGVLLILGVAILWALKRKRKTPSAVSPSDRKVLDVINRYDQE